MMRWVEGAFAPDTGRIVAPEIDLHRASFVEAAECLHSQWTVRRVHCKGEFVTKLEQIEQRSSALKVNELAKMLQVTPQHIYRLASAGPIPCFRIEGAIRLDPHEVAEWLKSRQPNTVRTRRLRGLRHPNAWERIVLTDNWVVGC
jgi:excisionase family DNA binding protein